MSEQRTFTQWYQDRRYKVTLDEMGQPIAYAVRVVTRGRNDAWRTLWYVKSGKPMPDKLSKGIMEERGSLELLAEAMGWSD